TCSSAYSGRYTVVPSVLGRCSETQPMPFSASAETDGLGRALSELAGQTAADFGLRLKTGAQALVWCCLGLLIWGLIFSLYLAVKYLPRLIHFLSEFLPACGGFLPTYGRMALVSGLALGLAAALAWISLPVSILLAAVFCAGLAATREKVFLFISASLILAASVGLSLGHHLFSRIGDGYLEALGRANYAPYTAGLYGKLAEYQRKDSSDLLPPFAMALLEKRAGNFDRAKAILSAMSAAAPNAGAVNNLGNIYFAQKSYDTAAACYRQAIEWNPNLAIAHYNLAQVHLMQLNFNAANEEQEKAIRLGRVEIEARASRYGSGLPMDQLISGRLLWDLAMRGWSPAAGFDRREMQTLAGLSLWLPPPVALTLLIALILWSALMSGRLAQEDCVTCGAVICRKCHTATLAGEKLCRSCADKIGLAASPDLQQQLAARLAARKHYRAMLETGLANLLMPGSVIALTGSTVGAWLLALGWSAAFVSLIAGKSGLPSGRLIAALAGNGARWWLFGAGGLFLIVSWLGYLSQLGRRAGAEPPLPQTGPAASGQASAEEDHAA
ncbi:MAG: tetratricopeptide repeat protein, partial [Candidatus Edwardsbacteria bacterium]|nr:tetratricopeptide repeat protein [Candidatus Edwardsbacteria bacterium]